MSKILKITTLEKGWCDKVEVLLHSSFQCLVDFVEKEKPNEIVDWNWNKEHRHAWKEINTLYKWWTIERPNRFDPIIDDETLKSPPFEFEPVPGTEYLKLKKYDKSQYKEYEAARKKSCRLSIKWSKEDQKNLHRLVDIRYFLWT